MGKRTGIRKVGAKRQINPNSNNNNTESDDDNQDRTDKNPFLFYFELLKAEQEIMDLYKKEFGYDPREPNAYKWFSEGETIERHATNIVFWRKLQTEYNVKEPNDIHRVKMDPRWIYISRKADEVAMSFYQKYKNIPGVNERIGNRVRELMID